MTDPNYPDNPDPQPDRPKREWPHHREYGVDAEGRRIWSNWADCTCSIGDDHNERR